MMVRITTGSNALTCPDFTQAAFNELRNLLTMAGQTHEQVIQLLERTWERQVESETRKPKVNDFDTKGVISNHLIPRPSSYALAKLERNEYVELWYFSREGCKDAALNHTSAARASQCVVRDADLSFRQFSMAKSTYLNHLREIGWPDKHVNALVGLFKLVESHPMSDQPHGEKMLLIYQARVREVWYDTLRRNTGTFNPAILNVNLLNTISIEVWNDIHEESSSRIQALCDKAEASAEQAEQALGRWPHRNTSNSWPRSRASSRSLSPRQRRRLLPPRHNSP